MQRVFACACLFFVTLLTACSTEEVQGTCTTGETMSCTCTGGATGERSCQEDNTFGECECASNEACSPSNPDGECTSGDCVDGECCPGSRTCGSRCCASGQTCMGGICATPCSASAPNGFCDSGNTCAGGSCCPTERACGSTCCPSGDTCSDGECKPPVCSSTNPTGECEGSANCIGGACCASNKVCGSSCCGSTQNCVSGSCQGQCVPSCGQAECGPNGCGGMCGAGTCPTGLACTAGTCTLDGATVWRVTVATGGVARMNPEGDAWDVASGAPDPKVCAEVDSAERCTSVAVDTYTPGSVNEWGAQGTLVAETSAAKLQAGILIDYLDDDVGFDDVICEGTRSFTLAQFRAGTGRISCTNQSSFIDFTLKPKP